MIYDVIWYDMISYHIIWYDTRYETWYDMIYDTRRDDTRRDVTWRDMIYNYHHLYNIYFNLSRSVIQINFTLSKCRLTYQYRQIIIQETMCI